MVYVEPFGGLCNRLRVIDSALALAEALGAEVNLIWLQDQELNCPVERLLQLPARVTKVSSVRLGRLSRRCHLLHPKYLRVWYDIVAHVPVRLEECDLERLWCACLDSTSLPEPLPSSRLPVLDLLCGALAGGILTVGREGSTAMARLLGSFAHVYARACRRFAVPGGGLFAWFSAPPHLREVVESVGITREMIGVHVRRTDCEEAIRASPTSAFVGDMEAEVRRNPCVRFFLATDSPEIEREMESLFGSRVMRYRKRAISRERPEAIEDAVVDLLCLSKCGRILGSRGSSFSVTAAQIGAAELTLVGA